MNPSGYLIQIFKIQHLLNFIKILNDYKELQENLLPNFLTIFFLLNLQGTQNTFDLASYWNIKTIKMNGEDLDLKLQGINKE